jgi:hypothetical protein
MHDPNFILFLDIVLAAWTAFDLRRALVTGRARLWLGGTVTRVHQPGPYWRYWNSDVLESVRPAPWLVNAASGNDQSSPGREDYSAATIGRSA